MTPLASILCAVLSAFALSAGIPNEFLKMGSSLLGLVALVPLYVALKNAKTWRMAGFLGGTMMMLVQLISSFWLAYFRDFAIFTLGGSALVCFGFGVLAGWLLKYALTFPENVRPFLFAAVYTIWEWFKSTGFFAYPWGTLVMTSRDLTDLIQIADLTGTWGIGFLLALVSAILAEGAMRCRSRAASDTGRFRLTFSLSTFSRSAVFTAALLVLATAYGAIRLATFPSPSGSLDVVMVQQNADSWDDNAARAAILDSEKLTMDAIQTSGKKPDLVIWSESTLPWPYLAHRGFYSRTPAEYPLSVFLRDVDAPVLAGSPVLVDPDNDGYSNSVILLSPKGEQLAWHGKVQLVPFAEYMPFTEYELVRKFFDKIVGFSRGWVPGTSVSPMVVKDKSGRDVRIATPICFEDAFSGLNARMHNAGSDVIVNLTNDSWSKTDSAEFQHFVIASFRTIELRIPMVRSTNAGYSVVVDPKGTVLADMPLFAKTSRFASVPVYPHSETFYARFGDWFPALLALLVLASAVCAIILDRKKHMR